MMACVVKRPLEMLDSFSSTPKDLIYDYKRINLIEEEKSEKRLDKTMNFEKEDSIKTMEKLLIHENKVKLKQKSSPIHVKSKELKNINQFKSASTLVLHDLQAQAQTQALQDKSFKYAKLFKSTKSDLLLKSDAFIKIVKKENIEQVKKPGLTFHLSITGGNFINVSVDQDGKESNIFDIKEKLITEMNYLEHLYKNVELAKYKNVLREKEMNKNEEISSFEINCESDQLKNGNNNIFSIDEVRNICKKSWKSKEYNLNKIFDCKIEKIMIDKYSEYTKLYKGSVQPISASLTPSYIC